MARPFDIFELLEQGCSPVERSIRQPGRCPGGDSRDTYLILDHAAPSERCLQAHERCAGYALTQGKSRRAPTMQRDGDYEEIR
jgi:hypothetical protein